MDAQGPERVRPFAQEAQATYSILVDQENTLGAMFGFKAIPNAFVIDEAGVLRYKRLATFTIKKPEIREELMAVLTQHFEAGRSAPAGDLATDEDVEALQMAEVGAARLFAEGATQYRAGRVGEALALWRRAWHLDPGNFIIRKQIWAVGAPDKFYPRIDFDWQKERLERGE